MNGYRPMVAKILQRRFPRTDFTFTNAGISSTCSTTGAFRLGRDVLAHGPVDLLFVEYAVNDDQDAGHARRECIRGLEGIVRQTLRHNPHANVVVTYFVNPSMLATIQKGATPLTIAAHRKVVEHYDISSINLAQEVADQIAAGDLTWKKFGGTHPAPHGNAICADMIDELMSQALTRPLPANAEQSAAALPDPLDENSYGRGRFVSPEHAEIRQGWKWHVPDWKSLPGSKRSRFTEIKMLCATEPGAELSLDFEGTSLGAYVVAGPDAGILEYSIDGGPTKSLDLVHRFSRGLHYPRTVMFATDLPAGEHQITLRLADQSNSTGSAARIMQFVAN